MIGRADLHLHSSASDGQLRPAELVDFGAGQGLEVLALTDHDSTEGVEEALRAAQNRSVVLIPGVELNAQTTQGEAHVLGYFLDPGDQVLLRRLSERRSARDHRAEVIVRRLSRLGYCLSWSRVLEIANGGSVGRPHIARALAEAGYVCDVDEAFRRLIRKGAPAYVPTPTLTADEAVQWILEARGLPVLAHPLQILESVPGLRKVGLVGLEVFYSGYVSEDMSFLSHFAESAGLLQTGGSDFHGPEVSATATLGSAPLPWEHVERLLAAARERGLSLGA